MTFSLRQSCIASLCVLAMALSGWSMFLSTQTQTRATNHSTNQPDAYMENVVATILNKMGRPKFLLETPKMLHYAEGDTMELTTPHVTIFRPSPEPWHINANYAKTKKGISEINFWDNVIINHRADTENPLTTLRTPSLTVLPDEQIAKTSEAVTMTQPDTVVQAIGMLANWNDGTVKLLSQAREEYVPHS